MQNKIHFKKNAVILILFTCFQLAGHKVCAQSRMAEIAERKDTINVLDSTIKALEKETVPDKIRIGDKRTRLMVLLIYNNNNLCGSWPSPSAKMEEFEQYWKCVFDNALYGKKFILSY